MTVSFQKRLKNWHHEHWSYLYGHLPKQLEFAAWDHYIQAFTVDVNTEQGVFNGHAAVILRGGPFFSGLQKRCPYTFICILAFFLENFDVMVPIWPRHLSQYRRGLNFLPNQQHSIDGVHLKKRFSHFTPDMAKFRNQFPCH